MVRYAALLRGISPLNPNMRNEKLRAVFEHEGLENVQTVITTGNVLFESPLTDHQRLEALIEKALPEQLGFSSTTFILSHAELQQIAEHIPFKPEAASPDVNLFVAFTKDQARLSTDAARAAEAKGYGVLGIHDRAIYCRVDLSAAKTPELMRWLEKEFSKQITTRTWKTVERILKKLDNF